MKKYVTKRFPSRDIPSRASEFMTWLESQLEATGVPQNEITISFSLFGNYESLYRPITFNLEFEREETEDEAVRPV